MSELSEIRPGTVIQRATALTNDHSNSLNYPAAINGNFEQPRVATTVIQHINGTAYLVLVILDETLDREHYIRKIREDYFCALCRTKRSSWDSLFTVPMIGTAQINQVVEQDPETRSRYPKVFITDYSYSDFLSYAWQQSHRLRHHESVTLPKHLISSLSSPHDCLGKRAIVVRQVLSKTKVGIMLLSLLILGIMLGVVVGISTGRADVAVAVAASIFACVTVLQGLIVWVVA